MVTDRLRDGLMLIGGSWFAADHDAFKEVVDPATEKDIGRITYGTIADASRAVEAAAEALPAWRATPATARAAVLQQVAHTIRERIEAIAHTIVRETGKTLGDARGEVRLTADYFQWFAEQARRPHGEVLSSDAPDRRQLVMRQPIGVVVTLTPWNFPISMVGRKLAAAFAAGCTAVSRPSEKTPFSAIALFECFAAAGLPPGVANLVFGPARELAVQLITHPLVRKVSFTGSTPVGRSLMALASENVTKVSLELGGNAPFIVFDDCDLDLAVERAMTAKYRNVGQSCIAANRMIVHERVAEEFMRRFVMRSAELIIGNGQDEQTQIGPLIDEAALTRVAETVSEAVAAGAKIELGAEVLRHKRFPAGYFYAPTILSNVSTSMRVASEELFAPVSPIMTFSSDEEAVRLANDTPFGLMAYMFTRSLKRAFTISEALDFGMVGINDPLPTSVQAPFGGVKQSGIGREGGVVGLEEYQEIKYLALRF